MSRPPATPSTLRGVAGAATGASPGPLSGRSFGALLVAASLVSTAACAQVAASPQAAPVGAARPAINQANYDLHYARARAAANGVARKMLKLCEIGPERFDWVSPPQPATFGATRAFDNLYYVGRYGTASWALDTSEGIILIDALSTPKDVEEIIVPNMRRLGLDPARIKYLVITHGHSDHYGGAPYVVDHFHPRVLASEADWKVMEAMAPQPRGNPAPPAPRRDIVVADGDKLTLGDTTVRLYLTPGHTPGTMSLILPLKDRGRPHVAVLWGGTSYPRTAVTSDYRTYGDAARRFAVIAARAGADVLLSNHGFADDTPLNLPAVAARKAGDPNPFVTGPRSVSDFMTVASECSLAREAAF